MVTGYRIYASNTPAHGAFCGRTNSCGAVCREGNSHIYDSMYDRSRLLLGCPGKIRTCMIRTVMKEGLG